MKFKKTYLLLLTLIILSIICYLSLRRTTKIKDIVNPKQKTQINNQLPTPTLAIPKKETLTLLEGKTINLAEQIAIEMGDLRSGVLILDYTKKTGDSDWLNFMLDPIDLDTPFRIFINLRGEGGNTNVTLSGKLNLPEQPWWKDIRSLHIVPHLYTYTLEFYDGRSPNYWFIRIPLMSFNIQFLDPTGKEFIITDRKGHIVEKVNLHKIKEVSFPEGLFPDKEMYVGIVNQPNTKMFIRNLLYTTPVKNTEK
jgi:hypothetical protein